MSCGPAFSNVFMKSSWLNCLSCGGLYGKEKRNEQTLISLITNCQLIQMILPYLPGWYAFLQRHKACHVTFLRKGKVVCIISIKDTQSTLCVYLLLMPTAFSLPSVSTGWGCAYLPHEKTRSLSYTDCTSQLQNFKPGKFKKDMRRRRTRSKCTHRISITWT